jgi:short-subunit dehydrogenase
MNVLITGATDGIGLELARLHHAQGDRLILIGRKPLHELDNTLFDPSTYCQCDLAQAESAEQVYIWLAQHEIATLDRTILNAATSFVGDLGSQSPASIRTLLNVNVYTPIRMCHWLMPLAERAVGRIAVIGSVASVFPGPNYAVYSACKAALCGFVRSLQVEMGALTSRAMLQIIHPGATRTGIHAKSGFDPARLERFGLTSAATVAQQIDRLLRGKRRSAATGVTNQLAFSAGRLWPEAIEWGMRRRMWQPAATTPARHCVITGAANGIGQALALCFARAGYSVTGVDSDVDQAISTQFAIEQAGGDVRFVIGNLADPDDVARIVDCLCGLPPIDLLIHNAGVSALGPFVQGDLERQMTVLDINLTAPILLTAGLLRADRLAAGGTLACISSLSHFTGYPGAAVYAASKDGLASIASSMAVALARHGISALTVYPGPTRTDHARRYSPDNSREAQRMAPTVLAKHLYSAVQRRQRTLIPGATNCAIAMTGRLAPGLVEQMMRRRIFDKLRRPR